MKRFDNFEARPNFERCLEEIGMNYWNLPSGPEKLPYWNEKAMYVFSETEIDKQQEATQDLHNMCIEMVGEIVKSGDYPEYFKLTNLEKSLIEHSWNKGEKSLYGRFDLVQCENGEIKMLEYNGDTPVSILECAVAQWHKIESLKTLPDGSPFPKEFKTQYNLLDETLIEYWQKNHSHNSTIHFAASGGFRHEDFGNLVYIMDTALRAGIPVKEIQMEEIGLETFVDGSKRFVDLQNLPINTCFKLYPWEWMTGEKFGAEVQNTNTKWLEPAWKMLLSNKAMLVKLWEMFPNHSNLLPSYAHQPQNGSYAKKAIHGREGSNIHLTSYSDGITLIDELGVGSHRVPEYDHWGYMWQEWLNIPCHDGYYPIIGSWVIGDKACGMSIREDKNYVTGMDAFFASHFFIPTEMENQYKHLWK